MSDNKRDDNGKWYLSVYNGDIWLSGGTLKSSDEVLNKVREIDPELLKSFNLDEISIYAFHTPSRSYYSTSKYGLDEWAENDEKPAYYKQDDEIIDDYNHHHRIIRGLFKKANSQSALYILFSIVSALLFLSFIGLNIAAIFNVSIHEYLLAIILGFASIPILMLVYIMLIDLTIYVDKENLFHVSSTLTKQGTLTTGFVKSKWYLKPWSVFFKHSLKRFIKKHYKIQETSKNNNNMAIADYADFISQKMSSLSILTNSERNTETSYDYESAVQHNEMPYFETIKLKNGRVKNAMTEHIAANYVNDNDSNEDAIKDLRNRIIDLKEQVKNLEIKTFNTDTVSRKIDEEIKTIDNNPELNDPSHYEKILKQTEQLKNAMDKLASKSINIDEAISDINELADMRDARKTLKH